MDTFQIDYDKLDVEMIMARIRQRVREKKQAIYSDAELERLGGLELPSPVPPCPKDPDRDRVPVPEIPEFEVPERLARRMRETALDDIKDTGFVTEAMRCVGEWNININVDDLYRSSHRGLRGKIINAIRSVNRKLFKLVMNVDVLFPQLHRQAILNQTYVVLLHTLVQEISLLNNKIDRLGPELSRLQAELTQSVEALDADIKRDRAESLRDRNDLSCSVNQIVNDFEQLRYKVEGIKGLIEGQRHQLEYVQARQRALEQLAVLKEEKPEGPGRKAAEIPRGRYRPKESKR